MHKRNRLIPVFVSVAIVTGFIALLLNAQAAIGQGGYPGPATNTPVGWTASPTPTRTNTPAGPTNTPVGLTASPTPTRTNTPAGPTNTPVCTGACTPTPTRTKTPGPAPTNTPIWWVYLVRLPEIHK